MEMTPEKWAALEEVLHPTAMAEVREAFPEGSQPREWEVLQKAIDAHATVTGITLTFRF